MLYTNHDHSQNPILPCPDDYRDSMTSRPHESQATPPQRYAREDTSSGRAVIPTPQRQYDARHDSAQKSLTDITTKHQPAGTALKLRTEPGGEGCAGTKAGAVSGKEEERERGRTTHEGGKDRRKGRERREREEDDDAVVCAWWNGYGAPHERPDGQKVLAHMYVTKLKPSRPLEEGRRVSFIALSMTKMPAPYAAIDQYDPYEPHVHGVVIRIRRTGPGWARATVLNECRGNRVGVIDLDLPHIPGVTVRRSERSTEIGWPEWTGETPAGCCMWEEIGGGTRCRGRRCELERKGASGEGFFRAIPTRKKGEAAGSLESVQEEGTAALHMWMKYEGYN
ncbi:hypothetical protein K466DRAFT_564598 [Polyporus arcularius HHB13444]|uniref:Uncharacterized protein n=1 Tax=Polyporus arcularius HHB13444 TaxID=1314778 RepID=A0A5C3PGL9_9APHY|nr:hypothetical protein K466DRAFT_564598 [Polyporus arcularius HHB13444]